MDGFDNTTTDQLLGSDDSGNNFPMYAGYIACALAVLFFGSNWVPVKKVETGEGMFFQWVACCGIWMVGLIIHLFRYPHGTFYPEVMIGGIIWTTGNLLTVPIIKTIGLGKGILIWASFNILVGWFTSRFGNLFGLEEKKPANETLNYIGAMLCLVSSVFYVLIKTAPQIPESLETTVEENTTLVQPQQEPEPYAGISINTRTLNDEKPAAPRPDQEDVTFFDKLSPTKKVVFGVIASVIAGCFYGVQFLPVDIVQKHHPDASKNGLDYVFAHWSGIFITSTLYFIVYAVYMRNNPKVFPKAILPGLLSGALWAVAEGSWFIANATLTQTISFPIVASGPSMVGALWGVYFKEIRGARNYIIMILGFSITITGSILTALSAL